MLCHGKGRGVGQVWEQEVEGQRRGIWLNFNPSERLLKETKGVSVYKPMPSANRKQLSATGQLSEDVLKRKAGCQGREPKG